LASAVITASSIPGGIPGTSSLSHLEENLGTGELALGEEHMAVLDGLAA
jgi:aryl-alcohol dehydrogenase-like predicted oxidoreductase